MKKKIGLLVMLLVFLGGAAFGAKAYMDSRDYVTSDDARIDAILVKATPEITGRVDKILVKEGDTVAANEEMVRLEEKSTTSQNRDSALVKAPEAGVVVKSFAHEGEVVSPGQRMFLLANFDELFVSARIEETRIGRIAVGNPVTIRVDAFPDKKLEGIVEQIGLTTDSLFSVLPISNSSGNYIKVTQRIPVKIKVLDTQGLKLMPGMNAVVSIATGG